MTIWNTPKTWLTDDDLDASNLNTYVRDQQLHLSEVVNSDADQFVNTAGDYSSSSGTVEDLDVELDLSITTTGRDVMITFVAYGSCNGSNRDASIGFMVDDVTDYFPIVKATGTASVDYYNLSFNYILTGLSAGVHTFKIRVSISANTLTIPADNTLFDVREIGGVLN